MLNKEKLNNLSSRKRWTKEEFIQKINPCKYYRLRIWWFFLWHKHITLSNIVNYPFANRIIKLITVMRLDEDFWNRNKNYGVVNDAEVLERLRVVLKKARKLN